MQQAARYVHPGAAKMLISIGRSGSELRRFIKKKVNLINRGQCLLAMEEERRVFQNGKSDLEENHF